MVVLERRWMCWREGGDCVGEGVVLDVGGVTHPLLGLFDGTVLRPDDTAQALMLGSDIVPVQLTRKGVALLGVGKAAGIIALAPVNGGLPVGFVDRDELVVGLEVEVVGVHAAVLWRG